MSQHAYSKFSGISDSDYQFTDLNVQTLTDFDLSENVKVAKDFFWSYTHFYFAKCGLLALKHFKSLFGSY